MLSRRHFMLSSAMVLAAPHVARAQEWPAKNITLVVPFAAGGGTDAIGRVMAEEMSNSLGKPVVVENRPGAGSNVGIEAVSRADPDGHTILIASIGFAINRFLYQKVGFSDADFTPISLVGMVPNVMAVPNSSPAKSVTEFIAYAKSQPGKLTYASAGTGSSLHLCAELFKKVAGVDMVHVPYRGSAPALADVMGGRVDCIFDVFTAVSPQITGGTLRGLGLTSARRIAAAGAMPTIAESGLPNFDFSTWFGLFVPSKTPPDVADIISKAAQKAAQAPGAKGKLELLGVDIAGSTSEGLKAHVQKEVTRWGPVIREAGIQPQ